MESIPYNKMNDLQKLETKLFQAEISGNLLETRLRTKQEEFKPSKIEILKMLRSYDETIEEFLRLEKIASSNLMKK